MVFFDDLVPKTIASELITFTIDGARVFFMINVHCMSHQTNLVVQTLFKLGIVGKIEDVLI